MASPLEISSVSSSFLSIYHAFLDNESQIALENISDAMDSWMEFIRIDPMDLIDDQPYNSIIFTFSVGRKIKIRLNSFKSSSDFLQEALRMTKALHKIGHHNFQETRFGPNQYGLLNIQNQFADGCDQLIKLLKATNTFLHFNHCLCNTFKSC